MYNPVVYASQAQRPLLSRPGHLSYYDGHDRGNRA